MPLPCSGAPLARELPLPLVAGCTCDVCGRLAGLLAQAHMRSQSLNSRRSSYRFWATVRRNQISVLGCLLVLLGASVAWDFYGSEIVNGGPWNSSAISATYVAAQLRELSPDQAALFLAYDVKNETSTDYHLADGPGISIMSRLEPDGSLSSQEQMHLSYATLIPAGQRARISIEITHAFNWPAENDPQAQQKLKTFVNQRVASVRELVLFDQADRLQVSLPGGWQQLKVSTAAVTSSAAAAK